MRTAQQTSDALVRLASPLPVLMRIATRLYLGFGVLLALVIALGALVLYDMDALDESLSRLSEREIPALNSDRRLARDFNTMMDQAHLYLLQGEPWRLVAARTAEQILNDELPGAANRAVLNSSSKFRELSAQVRDLEVVVRQCEDLTAARQRRSALSLWERSVSDRMRTIGARFDQIQNLRADQDVLWAHAATQRVKRVQSISLGVTLTAFVATLIATIVITRSLLIPIRRLGRAVQAFAAGGHDARVSWPHSDELGALAAVFNQMADRIDFSISSLNQARAQLEGRNEELTAAYSSLQSEMELAARIQRSILLAQLTYGGVSTAADMVAASDIGGDFYDVLPGPADNQVVFVIGDVAGKGIAAALLMVFLMTTLREISQNGDTPAVMLEQLNRRMVSRFGLREDMYATCALGLYDVNSGSFSLAKAGHEEPLWFRRRSGECESLAVPGLFLGAFSRGGYETRSVSLEPGDRVLLYTDGMIEARDPAGRVFGEERLFALMKQHGSQPVNQLLATLRSAVYEWTGHQPMRDDMTLLVFQAAHPVPQPSPPAEDH